MIAKRYANGAKYKAEDKRRQNAVQRGNREAILAALETQAHRNFGFQARLLASVRNQAIDDPSGDVLDAVLAAVQAAWSAGQQEPPDGIPRDCDPLEGWIVDLGLPDPADRW